MKFFDTTKVKIYLSVALIFQVASIYHFEIATHANISHYTYQQSDLVKDPSLISDLGLDLYDNKEPFGRNYFDLNPLLRGESQIRLYTR